MILIGPTLLFLTAPLSLWGFSDSMLFLRSAIAWGLFGGEHLDLENGVDTLYLDPLKVRFVKSKFFCLMISGFDNNILQFVLASLSSILGSPLK